MTIQLNYSLDRSHFFDTAAKKDLMQAAANAIAGDLTSTLGAIVPSGTNTWTTIVDAPSISFNASFKNPSIPTNTVIVYVLGSALGGNSNADTAGLGISGGFSASGTQDWIDLVSTRGQVRAAENPPHGFGPWGGAILFDTSHTTWFFGQTVEGLRSNQTDFLSVAEHEIAHVLGFGVANSWFSDVNQSAGTFVGPTAERVNNGRPVPLDSISNFAHWARGTVSDGKPASMTPFLTPGTRELFTTLDFAGLADVGWQVQAPILQLAASAVTVPWNSRSVALTITRSGGNGAATVRYATVDGSAKAGVDYMATSGVAVFANGQTSATILVPLLKNPAPSGNVSFGFVLSQPTAYAVLGSRTSETVNILITSPPKAPVLTAATDTGISHTDGITMNNATDVAPLSFAISGVTPANAFVRLYRGDQLVAGPVQASGGLATITLGAGPPIPDGSYAFTATDAVTATGTETAHSLPSTITIQTSLRVISVTPGVANLTALPNGQVTVTLNHPVAGITPNDPSGGGFANNRFAVYLVPRGPGGVFAAPAGLDDGSTPIDATLIYKVNANGTSTITLKPQVRLGTDVYLIAASGTLTDLAGNRMSSANGTPGTFYSTFLLRTTPPNGTPLMVVSMTTLHASVNITNNATIPQPDTIAVGFNKPVNFLMLDGETVQLLAGLSKTPLAAAVAYSPTTRTVYLTPQTSLVPGVDYTVRVDQSVTDDQAFPNPDPPYSLGQAFTRSFRVKTVGVGSGGPPLQILTNASGMLATSPGPGLRRSPFGYASIPFSEPLDMTSLRRFTVMLSTQAGGLNNQAFDVADAALNAKLAFNSNTNTLIVVPTVPLGNGNYLYTIGDMMATNGGHLISPTGKLPIYVGFTVDAMPTAYVAAHSSGEQSVRAGGEPLAHQGMTRAATRLSSPATSINTHPVGGLTTNGLRRKIVGFFSVALGIPSRWGNTGWGNTGQALRFGGLSDLHKLLNKKHSESESLARVIDAYVYVLRKNHFDLKTRAEARAWVGRARKIRAQHRPDIIANRWSVPSDNSANEEASTAREPVRR